MTSIYNSKELILKMTNVRVVIYAKVSTKKSKMIDLQNQVTFYDSFVIPGALCRPVY